MGRRTWWSRCSRRAPRLAIGASSCAATPRPACRITGCSTCGRALEAYVLGDGGYDAAGVYGPGAVFRPTLFPGLEIAIDSLWVS